MWRSVFLTLSTNRAIYRLTTRSRLARRVVSRFVAGETLSEALTACRKLNERGASVELHYLGESVMDIRQVEAATLTYLDALDAVAQSGGDVQISIKPSQMGQLLSDDLCYENVGRVARAAEKCGNFVWMDMEGSAYAERTVRLYEKLRAQHRNLGIALQAYLRRCDQDVRDVLSVRGTIRLCKGAYNEPPEIAFPRKRDVDHNYRRLAEVMLCSGLYQALATHDDKMIQHAVDFAREHGVGSDRYEFQMLYGVRRDLQDRLLRDGYRVRVYVPYGEQWYPYFMRRLAERPANLIFVIRSIMMERGRPGSGSR